MLKKTKTTIITFLILVATVGTLSATSTEITDPNTHNVPTSSEVPAPVYKPLGHGAGIF